MSQVGSWRPLAQFPHCTGGTKGKDLRQLCLEGFLGRRFLETRPQGTCEEDEGPPLAVLALRAGGIPAVSGPAAVFPRVRARGVHQLQPAVLAEVLDSERPSVGAGEGRGRGGLAHLVAAFGWSTVPLPNCHHSTTQLPFPNGACRVCTGPTHSF